MKSFIQANGKCMASEASVQLLVGQNKRVKSDRFSLSGHWKPVEALKMCNDSSGLQRVQSRVKSSIFDQMSGICTIWRIRGLRDFTMKYTEYFKIWVVFQPSQAFSKHFYSDRLCQIVALCCICSFHCLLNQAWLVLCLALIMYVIQWCCSCSWLFCYFMLWMCKGTLSSGIRSDFDFVC